MPLKSITVSFNSQHLQLKIWTQQRQMEGQMRRPSSPDHPHPREAWQPAVAPEQDQRKKKKSQPHLLIQYKHRTIRSRHQGACDGIYDGSNFNLYRHGSKKDYTNTVDNGSRNRHWDPTGLTNFIMGCRDWDGVATRCRQPLPYIPIT